ncbi:MAG: DegT/DnrJ/EryC1/StrS family aminotransferase [Pirellula sp.]|nr:DegT/DnrJ/EryC1/StrS family aminotransferase [Pirellula sp.]
MSNTPSIQVFRPTFRVEECLDEIRQCLEMGWTGMGFKTVELEKAWCEYTGLSHAHFLSSATVGLHLAIKMLAEKHNWQEGDEIITTPMTFVSTNHAIMYERFQPVFADVDEYLCLDPESVESRITPRTKAIMFVGLGGNTGRLPEIQDICKRHNLKLILDAAHMAGSRLNGKHVGFDVDVSVFSYQAVKNLPTADSGMICFSDAEDDQSARKWSWLGINKDTFSRTVVQGSYKWYYDVENVGFKYHGNSIMASLGLVGLRHLDQDNAYRRQLANWYTEALQHDDNLAIVPIAPGCESSRHLFQVLVDNRDEVMMALGDSGVHPGVHYRDNTQYKMYQFGDGTCPKARAASNRTISLPMHLSVTKNDVNRICDQLKTVLAHAKQKWRLKSA